MFRDLRLPERFWAKVAVLPSGCWEWTGARTDGYGAFRIREGKVRAHRHAYLMLVGLIAESDELDHLCRNRACVNPDHLEPVSRRTNQLRGQTFTAAQVARTHCPREHPYDAVNTYWHEGHRHCRTCQRDRNARRRAVA